MGDSVVTLHAKRSLTHSANNTRTGVVQNAPSTGVACVIPWCWCVPPRSCNMSIGNITCNVPILHAPCYTKPFYMCIVRVLLATHVTVLQAACVTLLYAYLQTICISLRNNFTFWVFSSIFKLKYCLLFRHFYRD